MAYLVVQSRFAGLQMEDEDYPSSSDGQKLKKAKNNTAAKKVEPPKKAKPTATKSQNLSKKKKSKQNAVSSDQWELWKQKDEELVDGNFEDELQQAILLSKLDYEKKKDDYKQFKKTSDVDKKVDASARPAAKKQQKKKNVMSLDQFNDMVNAGDETKIEQEEEKSPEIQNEKHKDDTKFFERVQADTKNEILKDKINDRVKFRQQTTEVINRVQFSDALERKDKEILELREEIINLKKELLTVKSRNKKLCNILGQGEMKDKAEVLVEVERLRAVQEELTAEIESLHTDLEKERSKNGEPRPKDKKNNAKKKNIRFDVSSEAILAKDANSGSA